MKGVDEIYPLTIVSDRYGGAYSNAQYLAFNIYASHIPDAIDDGDGEAMMFWAEDGPHKNYLIGKGSTPDLAAQDLLKLL